MIKPKVIMLASRHTGKSSASSPIQGHFFFVDIVGLSDPKRGTTESQIEKIKILHKLVSECNAYASTSPDKKYVNLTGDGMVIGFLEGPHLPLELAIELQRLISNYNKGEKVEERVEVRIGIDSAPILAYTDILGKENVWGDGIIIAKRIMDFGDAGHILLNSRAAEGLRQFDDYKNHIHEIGERETKHKVKLRLFSAYGPDFGNRAPPKNGLEDHKNENFVLEGRKGPQYQLENLITDNFFEQPRSLKGILEELSTRSIHYEQSDLTRPLEALVLKRKLRRKKIEQAGKNVWHWVNW